MIPSRRSTTKVVVLASFVCALTPVVASATTYSFEPHQTILLSDATTFIAHDAWNSVALYRIADGSVVHRFPGTARIGPMALSPDERHLLVSGKDGSLMLWRLADGERVWELSARDGGQGYVWDVGFAGNGERCAVCAGSDTVVVFDTRDGARVAEVRFPPRETNVITAALAPAGDRGLLIELGGRLCQFDLAGGTPVPTRHTGAGPARMSADGKWIAFRSNNSGQQEELSLVEVATPNARVDVGNFRRIGAIRPQPDGSFIFTAVKHWDPVIGERTGGFQVTPGDRQVRELWALDPHEHRVNHRTTFDPRSLLGVSTDFRLVTRIADLRTGNPLRVIDNSANARAEMMSTTVMGLSSQYWPATAVWCVSGLIALLGCRWVWRRVTSSRRGSRAS
ncbi:MAG: WD40 repeat domain-containing protein [Gemmataceae bacterium]